MKLYKLKVSGSDDDFVIQYTESTDFSNYHDCAVTGTEQEKFEGFLADLKKNGGGSPINVKVNMANRNVDRALPKSAVLSLADVKEFIQMLDK